MSEKPNPAAPGFNMEIPEGLQALYSNIARISHTPFDFTLDFSQALPGKPQAQVQARVIMAPVGAKLFLRALADNISRYEATFGEIVLPKGDSGLATDLFRKVQPPDAPPPEA